MFINKSLRILKSLAIVLIAGIVMTTVACTTGTTTTNTTAAGTTTQTTTVTTTQTTTVTTADMEATLTDLAVDGITVMGFNPLIVDYVLVLTDGTTATPTTTAVKLTANATVAISPATDVTSAEAADRTTTVTVTSADASKVKTYSIRFEAAIAPVDLGTADNFVILGETGISTATTSIITGDIGVSPAAATYITGFSLIMDSLGTFATSSQVVGNIYASDYTSPTPSVLTTAIADMQTAYVDAAGRAANYTELFSGDLSGKTLTPGVYMFGTSVLINTNLTLTGSATDVWIFQIAGTLTQAANIQIILAGGALAKNIIWVVADTVAIGTGAHFEGTILAMTNVSFGTNASINGRIYAQTAVTLDACTVVKS